MLLLFAEESRCELAHRCADFFRFRGALCGSLWYDSVIVDEQLNKRWSQHATQGYWLRGLCCCG